MKKAMLFFLVCMGFAVLAQNSPNAECQIDDDCQPRWSSCRCAWVCGEQTLMECASGCADEERSQAPECFCDNGNCVMEPVCGDGRCESGEDCDADCRRCAKEGEYTTGAVAPEYAYGCCEGLEGFNTVDHRTVGAGVLCYEPAKGTPVCKFEDTRSEGWYYQNGELLRFENCQKEAFSVSVKTDKRTYSVGDKVEITATIEGDTNINDAIVKAEINGAEVRLERGVCGGVACNCVDASSCSCDTTQTCFYTGAYTADEEGDYTLTVSAKIGDNIKVAYTVFQVGSAEHMRVRLGERFKMAKDDIAVIVDNGMELQYLGANSVCADCANPDGGVCRPCGETHMFRVTPDCKEEYNDGPSGGCAGFAFELQNGQTRRIYDIEFSMLGAYDDHVVVMAKNPNTVTEVNARLNERFQLREGQTASITDYNYMKVNLDSILATCSTTGECHYTAYMFVGMPCTAGVCREREALQLSQGRKAYSHGVTIEAIAITESGGTFVVTENEQTKLVEIDISPASQTIAEGESAEYEIRLTDLHPAVDCERCLEYAYSISVQNLPFAKEYRTEVTVEPGETVKFPLKVMAGVVVVNAVREAAGDNAVVTRPLVQRSYQFNVVASNSNTQAVAQAELIIEPKVTPPPMPKDTITIKLHKGWNLISLPGEYVSFSSDDKFIGFVYIKSKQRYMSLAQARSHLGSRFKRYLATNAFWVYARQESSLEVTVDTYVSSADLDMVPGWNMLPVTDDMVNGRLSDVIGDCEIEKAYMWDAENQQWEAIDGDFSFKEVGYGFLAKALNYCQMSGPELTPPSMPG